MTTQSNATAVVSGLLPLAVVLYLLRVEEHPACRCEQHDHDGADQPGEVPCAPIAHDYADYDRNNGDDGKQNEMQYRFHPVPHSDEQAGEPRRESIVAGPARTNRKRLCAPPSERQPACPRLERPNRQASATPILVTAAHTAQCGVSPGATSSGSLSRQAHARASCRRRTRARETIPASTPAHAAHHAARCGPRP